MTGPGSFAYRLCAHVLAALPLDAAARRVFDETLADWRREQRTFKGIVAVLRGIVLVAGRDIVSPAMGSFALRVAGWTGAWLLAGVVVSLVRQTNGPAALGLVSFLLTSILGAAFFLPVAIFFSMLSNRTRQGTLGVVVAVVVLTVVATAWVLPATSRTLIPGIRFIETGTLDRPLDFWADRSFKVSWPSMPVEFLGSFSSPQLVASVVAGPPEGWWSLRLISFRAAFVALCALMPFVALSMNGRRPLWRVTGVVAVAGVCLYWSQLNLWIAPRWIFWMFAAPWVPVATIGLGMTTATLRTRRT